VVSKGEAPSVSYFSRLIGGYFPGGGARATTPVLFVSLFFVFFLSPVVSAAVLAVPGTGACETVMKKLAKAFNERNPIHKVAVPTSTGSAGGIRAVIDDEAAVARVARPLTGEEAGAELTYRAFARDAVVFGVGREVKLRGLSRGQLADIFGGKIGNWREVGGESASIYVLIREDGDSSLNVIREHIGSFNGIVFAKGAKRLYHDYEMVKMLKKYRKAVGWLTASELVGTGIKPLAIDGVAATADNLISGRYALVIEYALVYKEARLAGLAREFVDFVFSPPGREVLVSQGLVPVGD
jgi:phosphate transport system substrate-binding protein